MEKNVFETIKLGVCSCFLILYSCIQVLQELWYTSAQDSLAGYLAAFAAPVLLLSGGLYLSKLFKKKLTALCDDEKPFISAAARFIGGWIILALVLKYLTVFLLFSMISGPFNLRGFLLFLIYYSPLLIAAVVIIRKGALIKERPLFSEGITFLCLRAVLIFICILSVRQILLRCGPLIITVSHEIYPAEIKWILLESLFLAAMLILFFAPLRLKINLKAADGQGYADLSRWSFTLAGFIILIAGIPCICDAVFREYDSFFFLFFNLKEFLAQILPTLFLILAGLFFIIAPYRKRT